MSVDPAPNEWLRRLHKGFDNPDPDEYRTPFQKDRDRVLYSTAFRRLGQVTQIASAAELQLVHNRLTHSLKVAQVGRRLCEYLRFRQPEEYAYHQLDPDLVETAGLCHDLGHPPFGHVAEDELDRCIGPEFGGYEGNAQTFRILTKFATRKRPALSIASQLTGLDLTRGSLNAVLKYPAVLGTNLSSAARQASNRCWAQKSGVYASEKAAFTFARNDQFPEGLRSAAAVLMDWADDISYAVHDTEDYVRAGFLHLADLGREHDRLLTCCRARFVRRGVPFSETLFNRSFNSLIRMDTRPRYRSSRADEGEIYEWASGMIHMCEKSVTLTMDLQRPVDIAEEAVYQVELLQTVTWEYIIAAAPLGAAQEGQRRLTKALYEGICGWADRRRESLPTALKEWMGDVEHEEATSMSGGSVEEYVKRRCIGDYIASLTEMQALALYHQLTGVPPSAVFASWMT